MKIGFIGLGAMGGGMAANLQKAGHELTVHDVRREAAERHLAAGATWAESPAELSATVEVVFTSLPMPADVEAVALGENGLLAGFSPGKVWFDLTTNSLAVVRKLHALCAEQGIHMLDAPLSGGAAGAAAGKLAIWVGGDKAVFERLKPLLNDCSDQARYIGPIGSGVIAKLVHNCASATIGVVLAEAMTMGMKAGLEPLPLWEAIRQGAAGRSRIFDRLGGAFLTNDYDSPSFTLRLMHKDLSLALQLGAETETPMRLSGLALQDFVEAMNRGWSERDTASAMALQVERSGVTPPSASMDEIRDILQRDGKS